MITKARLFLIGLGLLLLSFYIDTEYKILIVTVGSGQTAMSTMEYRTQAQADRALATLEARENALPGYTIKSFKLY